MNESGHPVTREELREAFDEALERYVTKNEFGGFIQLVIDEQERSARRHEQVLKAITSMSRRLSATEQRIVASEDQLRGELIEQISATEQRLMVEIGRSALASAEERRRELGVLDDRYSDLPGRVSALEQDLREHVEDAAAHGRPRRPRRKR
jgi:sugar-specific transcriptional regulator TrmB